MNGEDEPTDMDFAFAEALTPLLGDDPVPVLSSILPEAKVFLPCGETLLLTWPDNARGVFAMAQVDPIGPLSFVAAWPFNGGLLDKQATVRAVHRYAPRPELAIVECDWEGNPLWLFDTFCATANHELADGQRVRLALNGWATTLRPARTDPIVKPAAKVEDWERDHLALQPDGSLHFDTSQFVYLLGTTGVPCPLHSVRGIVSAIGPEYAIAGTSLRRLTVIAARSADGEPERELALDLSITRRVWGADWPEIGHMVEGTLWLEGTIVA